MLEVAMSVKSFSCLLPLNMICGLLLGIDTSISTFYFHIFFFFFMNFSYYILQDHIDVSTVI
jgi:hypothetical protein